MPTGILFGQIFIVLGVAFGGVWSVTQWTAHALGYQPRLGAAWFDMSGVPVYEPWKLFEWWYFYDAYAPDVFLRGGTIAASSGLLATGAAMGMAVWHSRLAKRVTTYGSARWADADEIPQAGLIGAAGVFLGKLSGRLSHTYRWPI
jgi:type IV secretion system protein VirD4